MPEISFSEQEKSLVFSVQWCVSCKLFILIYKACMAFDCLMKLS